MATPYVITGVQAGLADASNAYREVPVRMDIDTWFTSTEDVHEKQRALFFPAFKNFCEASPKDKLSYFQIAGIHGMPHISWDEAPQRGVSQGGYCTHNSILFTTWHRPYLLLFEQAISEFMAKEVANFPAADRDGYLAAARKWRLPFWDWAAKKTGPNDRWGEPDYTFPAAFQSTTVTIKRPSGKLESFPNALYQFTMPHGMTMGDKTLSDSSPLKDSRISAESDESGYSFRWDLAKATSRRPVPPRNSASTFTAQAWINGIQNNSDIVAQLRDAEFDPNPAGAPAPPGFNPSENHKRSRAGNMTASLRDAFYRIATITTFEGFSTSRVPTDSSGTPLQQDMPYDSCESLHNNIHGWCGGGAARISNGNDIVSGHMGSVAVSAFDPIFWFHHCNIDRITAIWQVLWDDRNSWFDGGDSRDIDNGNFYIRPDHADLPTDNLRPFHKAADGSYWTSNSARDPVPLGYTYPGLEKWKFLKPDGTYNKAAHQASVIKFMNDTYNSSKSAAAKSLLSADPGATGGIRLANLSHMMVAAKWEPQDLTVNDYVVNVVYEKFALGGRPFDVCIFIGPVPAELPYDYHDGTGALVGEVHNFSATPGSIGTDAAEGCANCHAQQADHSRASGRVVLTNALITRWKQQVPHAVAGPDGTATMSVLASMEVADVVPFLKDNLQWRVVADGRVLDIAGELPSLRVAVGCGQATHFADETKLSTFGEYKAAYAATQGKPGGAGPEDGLFPAGMEV